MRYRVYEVRMEDDELVFAGDDDNTIRSPLTHQHSHGYDFRRALQQVLKVLADRGERLVPKTPWPFRGDNSLFITESEESTEKHADHMWKVPGVS